MIPVVIGLPGLSYSCSRPRWLPLGVAPSTVALQWRRLDREQFSQFTHALAEAGFKWENRDAAELLAALRATCEPLLDAVAVYLLLPLPGWMPEQHASDDWQRGSRGTPARYLVRELNGAERYCPPPPVERLVRWRRLRRWLGRR